RRVFGRCVLAVAVLEGKVHAGLLVPVTRMGSFDRELRAALEVGLKALLLQRAGALAAMEVQIVAHGNPLDGGSISADQRRVTGVPRKAPRPGLSADACGRTTPFTCRRPPNDLMPRNHVSGRRSGATPGSA